MADVVTRLVVESKEYDSKIARATSGLTQFEKKCREVGGTLEFVEKEDLDFVKALGQMDTVATTATGKLGELKKAFTELSVQYKNLTDAEKQSPYGQALAGSLDELKGRIGDLGKQISEANGELNMSGTAFEKFAGKMGLSNEALGQVGQAMGSLGPAASGLGRVMTGALGPVGIAIAAVVAAIKQLIDAFKRNEDAMESVQKIAAPFKAIWQSIQRLFDDIVKIFQDVYTNLEKAAGGFSGFKAALAPAAAVIAAVRASLAVLGTVLTDIAKGVAYVADKVRGAMQGSTVGKFFQGINDTVQGFFTKFTGWVEKIANSKLGKALGLDSLYVQLKEIVSAQDELTASNRKIAQSENELNKLRRSSIVSNAQAEKEIAKLREQASERDKFSADERVKMLEQAASLEEQIMQRNLDIKRKELELIKLKNSLTQSGTQDLDAQAAAEAAVLQEETNYYNKKRALQRQLQAARNEDARNQAASGGGGEDSPVEGSIAAQEEEVKRLTDLWKNASAEVRDDYKKQLEEAQKVLDEMTGKSQGATPAETGATFNGPSMSAFEKLQQSIRIKLADQNFEVDQNSLTNLMTVAIQNGIDGLNGAFEGLQYQLAEGLDIPDSAWQALADQINEQLANLGLDPIVLDVTTGGVEAAKEGAKSTADAWQNAVAAVNNVGSALQQIEDPAAKVAGIVMQAVANIALGFAQAVASPATGAAGVFGWIAAATAGLATMVSTIAAVKSATSGSYASGGIIPGNSYSGDNLTANVNSGELILNKAQQGSIASQLTGNNPMQNLQLSTEISGTNLRIVMNNDNRSKGGSRGYYANIH